MDSGGEVLLGEMMLHSGTDPESYITEYTLIHEEAAGAKHPLQPSIRPLALGDGPTWANQCRIETSRTSGVVASLKPSLPLSKRVAHGSVQGR